MRVAFGIDGLAPEWITTFLVDRTQQVMSTLIYWLVEFRRTKEIGSRLLDPLLSLLYTVE